MYGEWRALRFALCDRALTFQMKALPGSYAVRCDARGRWFAIAPSSSDEWTRAPLTFDRRELRPGAAVDPEARATVVPSVTERRRRRPLGAR